MPEIEQRRHRDGLLSPDDERNVVDQSVDVDEWDDNHEYDLNCGNFITLKYS